MTFYNADLGKRGVEQLDVLFGNDPYSVVKMGTSSTACLGTTNPRKDFLCYNETALCLFDTQFGRLSPDDQRDIQQRLRQVSSLADVAESIDTL